MTPGELAELDRKVAEAIGAEVYDEDWWKLGDKYIGLISSDEHHAPDFSPDMYESQEADYFMPSTDWNDAMYALKKSANCASFRIDYDVDYGIDKRTGWSVCIGQCQRSQFEETGPIAICNAILALRDGDA